MRDLVWQLIVAIHRVLSRVRHRDTVEIRYELEGVGVVTYTVVKAQFLRRGLPFLRSITFTTRHAEKTSEISENSLAPEYVRVVRGLEGWLLEARGDSHALMNLAVRAALEVGGVSVLTAPPHIIEALKNMPRLSAVLVHSPCED